MNNTMWALVKAESNVGLWLKRVPIPEVGKNDVKIKIRKTSICGTDVHIYNWNAWAQNTITFTSGSIPSGTKEMVIEMNYGHIYTVSEILPASDQINIFCIGQIVQADIAHIYYK